MACNVNVSLEVHVDVLEKLLNAALPPPVSVWCNHSFYIFFYRLCTKCKDEQMQSRRLCLNYSNTSNVETMSPCEEQTGANTERLKTTGPIIHLCWVSPSTDQLHGNFSVTHLVSEVTVYGEKLWEQSEQWASVFLFIITNVEWRELEQNRVQDQDLNKKLKNWKMKSLLNTSWWDLN